ncbi:helix-turn-helix transcriptional regulator [Alteromonas mediterranea]|uniref:Helix-turn-helix transcriptional regulator n=1 Tax=Alteromonas mediterranea TaxID=314275 RepID=A0AAC9NR97_9ALTE|nr:response regulator transcription factor [Alteromonas mediterranea]APD89102.1 helix-turn-helix transcriptional regulator [Alteromonas mediterranea]APD93302.1 helix-turn-helix transcriptional regulator [Alteromonas mediterranea]APD96927.1 helix-turn-helix transcriptional regulator [Alteromonas mediterranea]QDG34043.1 response regulator transcription factor [Alteromonas mediterranea]QDG37655.1 response regulator transcription factor [Alteromonas mediterranea]
MRHFIAEKDLQGALTQYSWTKYNTVTSIECKESDCIWILATDDDWRQQLIAAKQKVSQVVLLTYKYDRLEMQTALMLGARAYCHALGDESLLASVARVIEAGGMWLPNELLSVTTSNVASNLQTKRILPTLKSLTNRERDVLSCILDGLSNKEIARELGITERTVKEYVGTLLNKFQAKDRISLLLRLGEFSHLKDAL